MNGRANHKREKTCLKKLPRWNPKSEPIRGRRPKTAKKKKHLEQESAGLEGAENVRRRRPSATERKNLSGPATAFTVTRPPKKVTSEEGNQKKKQNERARRRIRERSKEGNYEEKLQANATQNIMGGKEEDEKQVSDRREQSTHIREAPFYSAKKRTLAEKGAISQRPQEGALGRGWARISGDA